MLPASALAAGVQIDPHADLLYRQALTLLEQADSQNASFSLKTSTTDQDLAQQGQALGRTLAPAVSLLKKAADRHHPVAQYRLALYYITYLPAAQVADTACPLLEASMKQGFAPPALGIENWCPSYSRSEYRAALESVSAMASVFAPYYPQPAVRLLCHREQPQGLAMQWGRQRDYQAEVYRLLASADPALSKAYWQKAVEINGCIAAHRHLANNQY
ncbi:sel1 repeat family protein [Pseudomonas rubra]|uniref:Sel1 repeat family protein n=1 Tax=Pseudomonas rubra TaxID=2942627 RepID=A0ABT5PAU8_9PSED|nr:sel1 repeat family protein [Pseudomonas rubra]MDD1015435.1 sel1 repeat family protein [Pseudomonas rubra]MDD1041249.1 sel1 repeat family protein [Pseudomonas rubra]MDD1153664.1 sel1 repeat family protein [Pseudomonas rubra]